MHQVLHTLDPQARHLISEDFMTGAASPDWNKYIKEFDRPVDLEPLRRIVAAARELYDDDPAGSDAWLAPRVHATLRLTRREASDSKVWNFLTVVGMPDYVRWRWVGDKGRLSRFVGPEYKQALSRLWWGAELTRNGADYSQTNTLFANQDFQNSWARLNLFHHRVASVAAATLLSTFNNGQMATSDQIRQLVKGLNMILTTTMLDAVAPSPAPDVDAIEDWINDVPDETAYLAELPVGPAESSVPPASIDAVVQLLRHTSEATSFFKRARSKRAEPTPEAGSVAQE